MYAVIETGGKQYRVQEGDTIFVEKLSAEEGETVTFDKIAALSKDDGFVAGTPYVDGAKVSAKIVKNGKAKKIIVYKYKAKKNYHHKMGHRQPYAKVQIEKIEA
jgi:large subunit ribosomal protein L21